MYFWSLSILLLFGLYPQIHAQSARKIQRCKTAGYEKAPGGDSRMQWSRSRKIKPGPAKDQ